MYLNTFYIQKSKLLLYPLLGIAFDQIKPENTFVITDAAPEVKRPLICAYKRVPDENYYSFRNSVLYKHRLFKQMFRDLEYDYLIFDMDEFATEYESFMKGKYSHFRGDRKETILQYYSNTRLGPVLIDTHLNPEHYHEFYADAFSTTLESIVDVHETLSPPDIKKETLNRYAKK